MRVNAERLWHTIQTLGEIGKNSDGGSTRLSFTEEEKIAKAYVEKLMQEAGMDTYTDQIGNLFGQYKGLKPELPSVWVGSHIDSVIHGGIFDGPAGVLSAVEAVKTLHENNIQLDHSIEVIAFTDEEGSRFSTGMLGSRAISGELSYDELEQYTDSKDTTIADAMRSMGYDPQKIHTVKRDPAEIKAYIELHIEQGKQLESMDLPVGVVTGIAGPLWLKVELKGEAGHAGTTPMNMRKDPMIVAAKSMTYLQELCLNEEHAVGTVGQFTVKPGGINIIPESVEFTMDIRDISEDVRHSIYDKIKTYIEDISKEYHVDSSINVLHDLKPVLCSNDIIQVIEESCHKADTPVFKLPSGAGHDAMIMANITDIGMIFVRSKDGISHNPKEWSDQEDIAQGAQVLMHTLNKLAKQ